MGKKKKEVSAVTDTVLEQYVDKPLRYKINLKCKNQKQKELVNTIKDNQITIVEGVFGVGKTFVINSIALDMLKNQEIEKIILILPTCSNSSFSLGHLPGTLEDKIYNFALNELDSFKKILEKSGNENPNQIINKLVEDEKIEIRPISFLRGASLSNAFMCVSEAEQFTKEDLFLIISRFESGKMVISGDPLQTDRKEVRGGNSGLLHAMERLTDIDGVGIVKFSEKDIVRNDILLEIYNKWKN